MAKNFKKIALLWLDNELFGKEYTYRKELERAITHLTRYFGNMDCENIKGLDVEQFLKYESEHLNPNTGKPFSKRLMKEHINIGDRIFEFALDNEIIQCRNPFQNKKKKVPKNSPVTERTPIDDVQKDIILKVYHRAQVAALIMLYCGLRRGEIIPLEWKDIDFINKQISVTKSVERINSNTFRVKAHTKNGKDRYVPIPDNIIPYLKLEKFNSENKLIYPQKTGNIHTSSSWTRTWESYQSQLNYKYYCDTMKKLGREPKGYKAPSGIPQLLDKFEQLAERIAKDGQLSPCIVAPLPNGKYELIDGRHRRRAVIKAGLPTTKCIIKSNLSDKEKKTIRLTANLIRNNDYLPSELAFAYKELAELEDMKTISEETNMSKKKIYRYIRLTYLIEPLLNRVDSGVIPLIAAVELSYVSREVQGMVFQYMLNNPSFKITTENARIIKFNGHSFPTVLEVIEERKKRETEDVDEEVDNLSTDDEKVSEPSETESTDDYRELAANALKPYHQNNKTDDEDLENFPDEEVDNLSTDGESASEPTEEKKSEQTSETTKLPELWFQDKNDKIHSCDEINSEHLKIICEYVIDETHIDYYIFRFAYDSKDVLQRWKENEIKTYHSSTVSHIGFADWVSSTKRMFQIRIGGVLFIMPHRVLEQLVRRYIRENYTLERIQKVVLERNS